MPALDPVDPPHKWATEEQQSYLGYLKRRYEAKSSANRLDPAQVLKLQKELRASGSLTAKRLARRRAICEQLFLDAADALGST